MHNRIANFIEKVRNANNTEGFVKKIKLNPKHIFRINPIAGTEFYYGYRCEEGWYLTATPVPNEVPAVTFVKGIPENKGLGKEKKDFVLYHYGEDEFGKKEYYLRPANQWEAAVIIGNRGAYPSGYINSSPYLYIHPADFYRITGMTPSEYEIAVRKKKVNKFIMSVVNTPTERTLTLQFKKGKSKIIPYTALDEGFQTSQKAFPVRQTSFFIPKFFLENNGIKPQTQLKTFIDYDNGIITVEAPALRCACCGEELRLNGSVHFDRGLLCEDCDDVLSVAQSYMSKDIKNIAERLAAAVAASDKHLETIKKDIANFRMQIAEAKKVI